MHFDCFYRVYIRKYIRIINAIIIALESHHNIHKSGAFPFVSHSPILLDVILYETHIPFTKHFLILNMHVCIITCVKSHVSLSVCYQLLARFDVTRHVMRRMHGFGTRANCLKARQGTLHLLHRHIPIPGVLLI